MAGRHLVSRALVIGAAWLTAERARAEEAAVAPPPPATATAAPEDAKVPVARAAFEEGIDLAHQGRWTEALGAFERSDRLWPHPVTTYNIGFCDLSLGKYTLAKKQLALALSARAPDGAPALPEDLRHSALEYSTEAEQSLVHVVLGLTPSTAQVSIDGRPLEMLQGDAGTPYALAGTRGPGPGEALPSGKIAVELDPGAHLFRVQEPGGPASAVKRSFAAGAHEELTLVAPPAGASDRGAPVTSAPAQSTQPPAALPDTTPSRTPAYVALGIGAAGLLTGSVAGIFALTKRSKLNEQCPTHGCPPGTPTKALDTANTAATVADVGFIVGAVGALTGGYLWWKTTPSPRASTKSGWEPSLGWRYAGVSGRF